MNASANRTPIAIFAYNRPLHIRKTLDSLKACRNFGMHPVIIFSDGPKKNESDKNLVDKVHEMINDFLINPNVSVIERTSNTGLAENIISGVSEVMEKYGKAIVVEDDLILSPVFLDYMEKALDFYQESEKIFSVSGYSLPLKKLQNYSHDIYFLPRCSSWGWASWKDRWEKVDWKVSDFKEFIGNKSLTEAFDKGGSDLTDMLERQQKGLINSWAVRWNYAHFKNNGLSVIPTVSLVTNGGCDNSGSHVKKTCRYETVLNDGSFTPVLSADIATDEEIMLEIRKFFGKSIRRKIRKFLRNIS